MSDERRLEMEGANDPVEPQAGRLTRGDLLRRAGAGAAALGVLGGPAQYAFAGPMKYKHKQLKGDLSIIQWAHFVPAYDVWFDGTWAKTWGERNDVQVKVDHILNTLLPARMAAESAAGQGHDLFFNLAPQASYEDQVIDHKEIV